MPVTLRGGHFSELRFAPKFCKGNYSMFWEEYASISFLKIVIDIQALSPNKAIKAQTHFLCLLFCVSVIVYF